MGVSETVQILFTAKDQVSGTLSGIRKNTKALSKDSKKNLQAFGNQLDKVGRIAAVGLAAGLAVAAKASIDFESSFAGVRKTVEASEEEFNTMKQQFVDLSKEIPVTVNEFARIGELAGQLGVPKDAIVEFSEVMAKMAVTTNLTSEEAATSFARIANIMQEPIENVDRMGSTVVDLGNNFATTEAEVVTFAERIAGAGNIAGLTTADIFGIGAAMSSVGVQAEAGGTATQKVLLAMKKATVEGNADMQVFAETAGMTGEEFKTAFEENAGGAFSKFVLGLGDQGDDAMNTLSELGMEDQRLMRSFLSLAGAGDLLAEAMVTSSGAFEENTALTIEAEKRFETTASQLAILKNNVTAMAMEFGNQLLPVIRDHLVPATKKLTEYLEDNQWVVYSLTGALIIFVAAWAAVKTAMAIKTTVLGISAAFKLLSATTITLTGSTTGLAGAMSLLAGPGAILALVAIAAYFVYKEFKDLQAAIDDLKTSNENLQGVNDKLKDSLDGVTDPERKKRLEDIVKENEEWGIKAREIEDRYEGIGGLWNAIADQSKSWGQKIKEGLGLGAEGAYDVGANMGDQVTAGAEDALEVHSPSKVFEVIGENIVQGLVNGMKDAEDDFKEVLEDQLKYAEKAITALASLGDKVKPLWESFKEAADEIKKTYRKLRDDLKLQIKDLTTAFNKQNNDLKKGWKQTLAENVLLHEKNIEELKQQSSELTEDYNKSNEERLTNLKESLAAENAAYAKSNADRLSGLQSGIAKEIVESQGRLSEAEQLLADEKAKGEEMNQDTITDLQARIDEENSFLENHKNDIIAYQDAIKAYTDWINMDSIEQLKSRYVTEQAAAGEANIQAIASLQSKYAEEKALADQAYQEKLAQLNLELADNQAFLDLHAEEIEKNQKYINNLRAFYRLDDVEQAKQTWKKERKAAKTHYEKELEILTAALETAKTKRTNKLAKLQEETKDKFQQMQTDLTDTMDYLFTKLTDKAGEATDRLKEKMAELSGIIGGYVGKTETSGIAGFADGGIVPGPIGSPQLAVVHGGEKISTVGGTDRGSSTININFNNPTVRSDADLNYIAGVVTEKLSRLNERIRLSGGI